MIRTLEVVYSCISHAPVTGILLGTSFLAFVLYRLVHRLFVSPLSKIPGPLSLKATSIFNKYHELRGHKREWLHELHSRYGEVVTIAPNEVSFASATGLKTIYSSGSKDFLKTELYNLFRQDGQINLFTAIDPHQHASIRKPLADRYSNTNILKSKILGSISERAETFAELASRSASFDVYVFLHAYALDCVTSMLFHPYGTDSLNGTRDKEMVELLSYDDSRIGMFLEYYSPILYRFWCQITPASPRVAKGNRMIRDYVESTLAKDNISEFSVAARLQELKEVPRELAVAECLDHLGAGIETTGDILCFLMWELSQPRNEARMNKLHEEFLDMRSEPLHTLPYLNAVIQEALRLWAPGTLLLPRYVPGDGRNMDGYFLPGHIIVGCQSYTLHRNKIAFPSPNEFIPERWLDPNGSSERQRLNFAFGLGARTCIGKHLAQAEIRALLHAVYSKYRTTPAKDMVADMSMYDQVLTSRPKDMCCLLSFELYDVILDGNSDD